MQVICTVPFLAHQLTGLIGRFRLSTRQPVAFGCVWWGLGSLLFTSAVELPHLEIGKQSHNRSCSETNSKELPGHYAGIGIVGLLCGGFFVLLVGFGCLDFLSPQFED